MLRVALIGFGYWGPNLARAIAAAPLAELAVVCDQDPARLEAAARLHPDAVAIADSGEAISWPVDAVVVATPASTHHPLALEALEAGRHVLVAKPLATKVAHAEKLAAAADAASRVLAVDHTFLYSPAVRALADLVDAGVVGEPLHLDSVRANLGLYQPDVDVIWDLAPHDFSIVHRLLGPPTEVRARGVARGGVGVVDVAHVELGYQDGPVAHVHVSWLSPVKVRRLMLAGSRRMVVYDDVEPDEKLRVYDRGVSIESREEGYAARVAYRSGDLLVPALDRREPLRVEVDEFAAACAGGPPLVAGGEAGVAVVAMLAAASRSVELGGAPVTP